MTQKNEVLASETLSQVRQSHIYKMSFGDLDAFVNDGVKTINLRQKDISKVRMALRPAILRVRDALSCQGSRSDLPGVPDKLTFDAWIKGKERLGSRATIYRLLADAGMPEKKPLEAGVKVKGKVAGGRKAGLVTHVHEVGGGAAMVDVLFEGENEAVACVAEKLVRVPVRRIAKGDLLFFADTEAEYRYDGGGKLVLTAAPSKAGQKKPCGKAKACRATKAVQVKAAAAGQSI
jgi:hypothetical protein